MALGPHGLPGPVGGWEQAPPAIEGYATGPQLLGWRLKMGMATKYEIGSSPEKIIQASELLWNNGFGCLELIEDSNLGGPGFQFSPRDGDGFCHDTCLKKFQYICALMYSWSKPCCSGTRTYSVPRKRPKAETP